MRYSFYVAAEAAVHIITFVHNNSTGRRSRDLRICLHCATTFTSSVCEHSFLVWLEDKQDFPFVRRANRPSLQ